MRSAVLTGAAESGSLRRQQRNTKNNFDGKDDEMKHLARCKALNSKSVF